MRFIEAHPKHLIRKIGHRLKNSMAEFKVDYQ